MAQTIPALFFEQAARYGRNPLFWTRRQGRYEPSSWEEAAKLVQSLGAYLLSIPVNPGDRIAILSENRLEWGIADLAIQSVRAWSVPIYPTLTEADILQIFRDCQPVMCVVSSLEQAKKVRNLNVQVPSLRMTIVMEPGRLTPQEQSWSGALEQGRGVKERLGELFARRLQEIEPTHTATLIYTSGTTGEPKGAMLSHQNFLSNAAACLDAIPISNTDLHLSFLPLSHVFERMAGWYLMMMAGASVAYAESMDTLPLNMVEVKPTVMLGVPRFFEKLYARVQEGLRTASPLKQRIAAWAMSVGQQARPYRLARRPLPPPLRWQYALADRLMFRKLQQRLGGRLKFFVSGSAPLSKTIAEFFFDAGVTILEGYGLTETSPVIAVNRPDALKFGTVGLPLKGVEIRIESDGEIATRGPHVMQGYYQQPDATQAVMTDGWFHTGDIGAIDAEGFVSITDRKKDLIKTAGGKFVAPQKLENLFVADPYVAQAFVYGDRERYCVALIVPNLQRLNAYATQQGLACASTEELVKTPAIQAFLWSRIQALQQQLASFEQVKAIGVLAQEFTQAAGELTPTLKAKRAAIAARYHDILQRLYQTPPPSASAAPSATGVRAAS